MFPNGMKSPHEVWMDDQMSRLEADKREKQWNGFLGSFRAPLWPYLISVVAWPVLVIVVLLADPSSRIFGPFLLLPGLLFVASLGQIVTISKRRQKAWLALIQTEAPELHARLISSGISVNRPGPSDGNM